MDDLDTFLSHNTSRDESLEKKIKYQTIEQSELTEQQKYAIEMSLFWWDKSPRQVLKIGGYAGTGKTTILKHILNLIPAKNPIVGAYTGKAVSVLRNKDVVNSETIHSLIYKLEGEDASGRPIFSKVKTFPHDLVIIDEASMVTGYIDADLRSYGSKILYVGDPGQLEPIENDIKIMSEPLSIVHAERSRTTSHLQA